MKGANCQVTEVIKGMKQDAWQERVMPVPEVTEYHRRYGHSHSPCRGVIRQMGQHEKQ